MNSIEDQACDSQLQHDLPNNQVTLLDCWRLSVDPTGNPGVGDERRSLRALCVVLNVNYGEVFQYLNLFLEI